MMSKIWEILNSFKRFCRMRGWKTSESEDWIDADDSYHNFLWTRNVSPSSFNTIISNRKCIVRNGPAYNVVEPSYLAWLFSEVPSEDLVKTIRQDPDLSKRIAIFDFSQVLEGKNLCIKLNNTDSPVFQEFESFLQTELKVKVEPLKTILDSDIKLDSSIVSELA